MKHEEGRIKGVRDSDIYFQAWSPDGEIKAVLLIVHGLGEHSGRYMNVVNHFVPLGYAIYGLDHLGHGRSEGDREGVEAFSDYTETLDIFVNQVKQWQNEVPLLMVAHSMGALIGLTYLTDHQAHFKAALISGPPVKIPENISAVTIFVGKILSKILPKVGVIGVDAQGVSRDPEVVKAYLEDPLVFKGKTPARLAAEMLRAMTSLETSASKIELPIFIIHGGADRIVDPTGAKEVFEKIQSGDKSIKYYEGYYHEVFNDLGFESALEDVQHWLDKQVEV